MKFRKFHLKIIRPIDDASEFQFQLLVLFGASLLKNEMVDTSDLATFVEEAEC